MLGRKAAVIDARTRDLIRTQDALVTLYDFVVNELDPEPHPIEAYFGNKSEQWAAVVALRRVRAARSETETHDE